MFFPSALGPVGDFLLGLKGEKKVRETVLLHLVHQASLDGPTVVPGDTRVSFAGAR